MTDLHSLSELASYLQRDLDTASATLAQAGAAGLVRGHVGNEITTATYTGVRLPIEARGMAYAVRVPNPPLTAVTAVTVGGVTYVDGTTYAWDGWSPWVQLNWIETTTATFQPDPYATLTYTAGFATVPADVKAVALAVAARMYDNPRGLRSESIDDYSITRAGADDDLAGVSLLAAEMRVLDRYRVRAFTVTPG